MTRFIVLGRFQPFHKGHEHLLNEAFRICEETDELVIAIGSASKGWQSDNPWTFEERKAMIESWLENEHKTATMVGIDDINDPPKWVVHATQFHGEGVLITSDEKTANLYRDSNWVVKSVDMSNRESFEGWRVRQTALMLSTVYDDDAVEGVLLESLPKPIVKWLIKNDAIYRLSTMGTGVSVG